MENTPMELSKNMSQNQTVEMSDFQKSTYIPKDKRKRILVIKNI